MAARQYWVGDNGQIYSSTNAANIPSDRPTYNTHAGATAQASVSATSAGNWPSTAAQAGYSYGAAMPQPGVIHNTTNQPLDLTAVPAYAWSSWPGEGWFWNGSSWQKNLTNEESYQDWINGGAQGYANWQAGITPGSPNYAGGGDVWGNGSGSASPTIDPALAAQQAAEAAAAAAEAAAAEAEAAAEARRIQNAAELLNKKFAEYGIEGLGPQITAWLQEGYSADTIALMIRDTQQYAQRFPAMKQLAQRGQALSEAEYIAMERGYRQVLVSYGLPAGFYDQPDDFSGFILNDISSRELDERVFTAKRYMDTNASPEYKDALRRYYGISEGAMLAYTLDANRAQDVIRREVRAAEIGGSAGTSGFTLDRANAERLAGSALGQTIDPFSAASRAQLEERMDTAREWANADRRLSGIEGVRYNELDAVDVVFGDQEKELASRKRAAREVGRFSGSSAINRNSLAQQRAQ